MIFRNIYQNTGRSETGKGFSSKEEEQISSMQKRIDYLEKIDQLTGVWNRIAFGKYLKYISGQAKRPGLLLINVDNMKGINTLFGYQAGDRLLKEMAGVIRYCALDDSIVARVEGDIFAILIPEATREFVSEVGNRILFSVRELRADQMGIPNKDYRIRVSIGSSLWDKKNKLDGNLLLEQAMAALAEARRNGRDQQIEFSENQALFLKMKADRETTIDLESRMNTALEHGEFFPVFQPQYDIEVGTIVGLEMLVRWQHPKKGELNPAYFLSTFENNHFIIELDLYMFEKACQILQRWKKEKRPIIPISCNFSGLHCYNPFWAVQLKQIAKKYQVSPTYLKIDIGERTVMEEKEKMEQQIKKLREAGFLVSLQGFGAGFSSVGILQNNPVDGVKIDRSIIMNDFSQEHNQMIFAGIISVSRMLKQRVYCVGIETKKQEEIIKKHGCHLVQGNYYCPPIPLDEAEELIQKTSTQDLSKRKQKHYSLTQARDLIEDVLNDYFIMKDIDRVTQMVSDQIEWKDILMEEVLTGKANLMEHFHQSIQTEKFHFNLYSCSVFGEEWKRIHMSGEGSIQKQSQEGEMMDRRFCFYAECVDVEETLKLDRFRMIQIKKNVAEEMAILEKSMRLSGTIRKNQALLDSMYGHLPFGIVRYDIEIDMMITYMNDAMLDIIGYTRDEFFNGKPKGNSRSIVYPEDLERVYADSLKKMRSEDRSPIKFRYVRKDGSIVWVAHYQYNVEGISGQPEVQSMCYALPDPDES